MPHLLRVRHPNIEQTSTNAPPTKTKLITYAKNNPRAFAMLYAAYVEPIFHHYYHHLENRKAAENATNQVFTKAIAALPHFTSRDTTKKSFHDWLFTITNNVLADYFRKTHTNQPLDRVKNITDPAPSPKKTTLAAATNQKLRAAMTHLPKRKHQIVKLHLTELTKPKITQMLNCHANAVDVTQFRTVAKLRTLLNVSATPKGKRNA